MLSACAAQCGSGGGGPGNQSNWPSINSRAALANASFRLGWRVTRNTAWQSPMMSVSWMDEQMTLHNKCALHPVGVTRTFAGNERLVNARFRPFTALLSGTSATVMMRCLDARSCKPCNVISGVRLSMQLNVALAVACVRMVGAKNTGCFISPESCGRREGLRARACCMTVWCETT